MGQDDIIGAGTADRDLGFVQILSGDRFRRAHERKPDQDPFVGILLTADTNGRMVAQFHHVFGIFQVAGAGRGDHETAVGTAVIAVIEPALTQNDPAVVRRNESFRDHDVVDLGSPSYIDDRLAEVPEFILMHFPPASDHDQSRLYALPLCCTH